MTVCSAIQNLDAEALRPRAAVYCEAREWDAGDGEGAWLEELERLRYYSWY